MSNWLLIRLCDNLIKLNNMSYRQILAVGNVDWLFDLFYQFTSSYSDVFMGRLCDPPPLGLTMTFWPIMSRFFWVFAVVIQWCDNISLRKDKCSIERVLVAVVELLLNVRSTSDRSDTRHVQTGIIRCCQPAIIAFEKRELTVGSPWRQGRLQGKWTQLSSNLARGKESPG
jgi:hypothetical protein